MEGRHPPFSFPGLRMPSRGFKVSPADLFPADGSAPGDAGEWACYHDRSNYYWAFVAGKKEEEAGLYAVRRGVGRKRHFEKLKMPPPCRMLSHPPPCKHRFWVFLQKMLPEPRFPASWTIGRTGSCYCGRIMTHMKFLLLSFAWVCMACAGAWGQDTAPSTLANGANYRLFPADRPASSQTPAAALGRQGHSRAVRTQMAPPRPGISYPEQMKFIVSELKSFLAEHCVKVARRDVCR